MRRVKPANSHLGSDLLHASGCTLNDAGAELIAEALIDNQTLNTLEVPGMAASDHNPTQ